MPDGSLGDLRPLTEYETSLLQQVLSAEHLSHLRAQLEADVKAEGQLTPGADRCYITIVVGRAGAGAGGPTWDIGDYGEARDADGGLILVNVCVADDRLAELEVWRPDGDAILTLPDPATVVVREGGVS